MEAKDTVKLEGELRKYCRDKHDKQNKHGRLDYAPNQYDLRLAQAEIAFKLGMKEVVEWIEEMGAHGMPNPQEVRQKLVAFDILAWQAKLKEWGI